MPAQLRTARLLPTALQGILHPWKPAATCTRLLPAPARPTSYFMHVVMPVIAATASVPIPANTDRCVRPGGGGTC